MQSPPASNTLPSTGRQQPAGEHAYPGLNAVDVLTGLGYGQKYVKGRGDVHAGREADKPPIILFQGMPLSSLPVTLDPPTKKEAPEAIQKLRSMFKQLRSKYGEHISLRRDPYVQSDVVAALQAKTFQKFVNFFDVTFVLFYNPFDDKCRLAKKNVRDAARGTRRENHAYAAVDCTKECELCLKHDIKSFPTMKLFSRGMLVNTYTDNAVLLSTDIQTFVESAPVMESAHTTDRCSVQ